MCSLCCIIVGYAGPDRDDGGVLGPRPRGPSVRRLRRGETNRTAFARHLTTTTNYNHRATGDNCAGGGDTSTAGPTAAGGRCRVRVERSQCIMRAGAL